MKFLFGIKRFVMLAILLTSILALGLFWILNDIPTAEQHTEFETQVKMYDLIEQLMARVTRYPDEAKTWYWLGRLYLRVGDEASAKIAFEKAYDLIPAAQLATLENGQM